MFLSIHAYKSIVEQKLLNLCIILVISKRIDNAKLVNEIYPVTNVGRPELISDFWRITLITAQGSYS